MARRVHCLGAMQLLETRPAEQLESSPGPPALGKVGQVICSLRGHDLLLHFEHDRLSLQCANCGWESPGWIIEGHHYERLT